jgi:ABC-type xylose transport system permease subunit
LKAEAQLAHQKKLQILEMQNTTDIEPFNRELSRYFLSIVYYFALGFLILVTIYALAFKGRTLGRKIMQVRLEGPVHSLSVFFHDVVFKYFFIIVVFVVSPYGGIALLFLSLIIDLVLISFTRKKATLRDILLKINVVKTGYGY